MKHGKKYFNALKKAPKKAVSIEEAVKFIDSFRCPLFCFSSALLGFCCILVALVEIFLDLFGLLRQGITGFLG